MLARTLCRYTSAASETVILPSANAANDSSFDRCSRSVSGSRCFATENVEVFRLFQTSFPPTRKRAKYVPDGLYRTRFCIAVVCQTFSSDVLMAEQTSRPLRARSGCVVAGTPKRCELAPVRRGRIQNEASMGVECSRIEKAYRKTLAEDASESIFPGKGRHSSAGRAADL